MSNGPIAADQMRLFIERAERLKEEIKGLQADVRDVFAEAKSQGFDTATLKEIIKLRAMEPDKRREKEALLDTYKAALGMLDGTPLGNWAIQRLAPAPAPDAADPEEEQLYQAAVAVVVKDRKASVSYLQRRLTIGYNRAARLVERMEAEGIVSSADEKGKRTVVAPAPEGAAAAEPEKPQATVEEARHQGTEAARAGQPVTSNPFPPRDPRRAAWDEAWCRELGSDGMDIPDALKPTPKPGKGEGEEPKGAGQ